MNLGSNLKIGGASQRFITMLLSLALLTATIFVYALLLRPAYADVNELRGELAAKSRAVNEQKKIVADIKKVLSEYQGGLRGLKDTVSLSLPPDADYPTLVNQLTAIARGSNINLLSVNLSALPGKTALRGRNGSPELGIIQIDLQLNGAYAAFKSFLNAIETNIRIMDPLSFSVSVPEVGTNYAYNLKVNTYYQEL